MKKLITLLTIVSFLFAGCVSQSHTQSKGANCGTKKQKKAKYNSMKRGTSPGGGMLN